MPWILKVEEHHCKLPILELEQEIGKDSVWECPTCKTLWKVCSVLDYWSLTFVNSWVRMKDEDVKGK